MATHKHAKKPKAEITVADVPTNGQEHSVSLENNGKSKNELSKVRPATESSRLTPTPVESTQPVKTQTQRTESQMSESVSLIEYSTDLADAEAPPPLPSAVYPATIEGAEPRTSQTKGTRYLALTMRISADDYPADFEGDPDGLVASYNRTMIQDTPAGRYRMKKLCLACGITPKASIDPTEFLGLTVNVATGIDEYEGEKRTVIQRIVGHD